MGHKLGQVFLRDQNILQKIIEASALSADDVVVEIGCGDGVLSEVLADKVRRLVIVEIDETCILKTKDRLGARDNVTYVHQDVLTYDFDLGEPFKVVANIPYYISAKIVKTFIQYRDRIRSAVVMVQKEFAGKLVADAGDKSYTSLAIHAQYFFDISYLFTVSRSCFDPVPNVDSAVIELVTHEKGDEAPDSLFFEMVRTLFWARRKPARSALAKSPYISLDKSFKDVPFLQEHGMRRGETMTIPELQELYMAIRPFFIDSSK